MMFKEEVEWDEPMILRYHDFLSEGEINTIKTLARPKVHATSRLCVMKKHIDKLIDI